MKKYSLAALAALAVAAVIVAISWPDASGVGGSCAQSLSGVKGFQASANADLPLDLPLYAGLDETETSLRAHAGKALVVNFWATWCGPCVEEMPTLVKLKQSKPDGIDVIAISEDRDGAKVVAPFLAQNKWDDIGITVDRKGAMLRQLKLAGLPTTLLVSPDGKEVARLVGPAHWDSPEVGKILDACLKPRGTAPKDHG